MDPIDQVEPKDPVNADELWNQVGSDRAAATQAEDGASGTPGTPDDPLAGLPEPTRKLVESLNAKIAEQDERLGKVGQQLATANGTMGNMKQLLDASRQALDRLTPTIQAAEAEKKAKVDEDAAAKAAELLEIEQELEDLPHIKKYIDLRTADVKPAESLPAETPPLEQPPLSEDERAKLIAQRELSDRHPGWIGLVNSKEFKEWTKVQPADIQSLAGSSDLEDAAKMIDSYKEHQAAATEIARIESERQTRLDRGNTPQGRGSSTGDVDVGPDALWNKVTRDRERQRQQA